MISALAMENVRLPNLLPGLLPPVESGQQRPAPRPPPVEGRAGSDTGDRLTLSEEGRARARRDSRDAVETIPLPADRQGIRAYRQEAQRPMEAAPLPQGDVYEGVFQRINELAEAAGAVAPTRAAAADLAASVPNAAPAIAATPSPVDSYRETLPPRLGASVDVFA